MGLQEVLRHLSFMDVQGGTVPCFIQQPEEHTPVLTHRGKLIDSERVPAQTVDGGGGLGGGEHRVRVGAPHHNGTLMVVAWK